MVVSSFFSIIPIEPLYTPGLRSPSLIKGHPRSLDSSSHEDRNGCISKNKVFYPGDGESNGEGMGTDMEGCDCNIIGRIIWTL